MSLQNNQSRAKTFIYNSLLLTLSAVLMRAVGVAYNVYISNRVGAEVMGLYSLVTNIWGFALTLATSGINLAATRCVAEAGDNKAEIRTAMRKSIIYSLSFGAGAAFLLLIFSKPISVFWLEDARAIVPLRIMSISLPVIAISSALTGYFSAVRRVWKSAAVQVAEQAIKIFGVAALLTPMLPLGTEYACIAIVLGGAIAEILSFVLYAAFYCFEKKKYGKDSLERTQSRRLNTKIFSIALPIAFSAYIRSGLTTVEHILIPLGLRESGLDAAAALETYGILSGMVLPVVMFPYALIHSFTGLLVPEVSGGIAAGEKRRIEYIATRVWRLTILFGLCGAGVLAVCSKEFGNVLYSSDEAGKYILMLAPLMPLMYLDTVTDSLLKGMGEQIYTMNVNIADAAISVILVRLLVPRLGISGYIAVLYIAELVNFAFSAARLLSKCKFRFNILRWFVLPLALLIASSQICNFLFGLFPYSVDKSMAALIIHSIVIIAVFAILLTVFGVCDRELRTWLLTSLGIKRRPDQDDRVE
ncbi:MAG: oligosaccharide flippase family protein [Eubacteriales bacterium]